MHHGIHIGGGSAFGGSDGHDWFSSFTQGGQSVPVPAPRSPEEGKDRPAPWEQPATVADQKPRPAASALPKGLRVALGKSKGSKRKGKETTPSKRKRGVPRKVVKRLGARVASASKKAPKKAGKKKARR